MSEITVRVKIGVDTAEVIFNVTDPIYAVAERYCQLLGVGVGVGVDSVVWLKEPNKFEAGLKELLTIHKYGLPYPENYDDEVPSNAIHAVYENLQMAEGEALSRKLAELLMKSFISFADKNKASFVKVRKGVAERQEFADTLGKVTAITLSDEMELESQTLDAATGINVKVSRLGHTVHLSKNRVVIAEDGESVVVVSRTDDKYKWTAVSRERVVQQDITFNSPIPLKIMHTLLHTLQCPDVKSLLDSLALYAGRSGGFVLIKAPYTSGMSMSISQNKLNGFKFVHYGLIGSAVAYGYSSYYPVRMVDDYIINRKSVDVEQLARLYSEIYSA